MTLVFLACTRLLTATPSVWIASAAPLAIGAGALAVWLTPWGKSSLSDGVRMLRSLRGKSS
jgi:hypothetical protein